MHKGSNKYFSETDIQKANKNLKKKKMLDIICQQMKTQTTMRYNFTPTQMAMMKKRTGNK